MRAIANFWRSLRSMYASVPLWFFGMACTRAWVTTVGPMLPMEAVGGIPLTAETSFDVGGLIMALTLALLARRLAPLCVRATARRVLALAMAASVGVLAIAAEMDVTPAFYGAALLGGAAFVGFSLCWFEFLTTFNPLRMIVYYVSALTLGELLSWGLQGYVRPYLYVMLALLPALGAWCLGKCASHMESTPDASPARLVTSRFPIKPIMTAALFALAFSFAEAAIAGRSLAYPTRLVWLLPAAVIVSAVAARVRGFSLSTVNGIVLVSMLVAAVVPLGGPFVPAEMTAAAIGMGTFASNVMGLLVLGQISFRLRISALWLFGMLRVIDYLGLVLGSVTGGFVGAGASGAIETVAPWLVFSVVLLLSAYVLAQRSVFSDWDVATDGSEEGGAEEPRRGMVAEVGDMYGLTKREEEILVLLLRGRSVASVAEDLFIAPGTVKAHVQHIYQKTGVHSRAELVELAGHTA